MLEGMRVLDLTDEKGYLAGKMLADLGAEVIKIEEPGGSPGRSTGPFYRDVPDGERSLFWFAYNTNKKSITLNLETADGREVFKRLVEKADVVIESFPPGYLTELGIGYDDLCKVNRNIILTSITPFGEDGPFSRFKASDIVLQAMGGLMATIGEPERAPVRIGFPQAYLFASADAAAGTLMAYYYREMTGEGQHVSIAAQRSVMGLETNPIAFWVLLKRELKRAGKFRLGLSSDAKQRQIWRCKDGWVSFQVYGGRFGAKTNKALVRLLEQEGLATDFLKNMDWDNLDFAHLTQEVMDKIEQPIADYFLRHTKAELEEVALKNDIVLYPVCNMGDVFSNPQLKARNYWVKVEHPELNDTLIYPGPWVQTSENPWKLKRAPLIGEHNKEIYSKELGFTDEEIVMMKQRRII